MARSPSRRSSVTLIYPRPRLRLAYQPTQHAAFDLKRPGVLQGQTRLVGLAVLGVVDVSDPLIRCFARLHPHRISTPMMGRARLPGSGLRISRLGFPVGSLGSLSHWIRPHNASPQWARRICDLPPSVNHVPLGSPANAGPIATIARPQTMHRAFAIVVMGLVGVPCPARLSRPLPRAFPPAASAYCKQTAPAAPLTRNGTT